MPDQHIETMKHTLDLYFIQTSHSISERLSNQAQTRGSVLQPVISSAINKAAEEKKTTSGSSHNWSLLVRGVSPLTNLN